MAITIDLFTSTFDTTKKAVRIVETGQPEQLLGTGQFYEINDAESGTTCFIYNSNGDLKLKALWADITIAGAVTPADKKDKLVSFFAEAPAGGGGGGTAVGLYKSPEIDFYNGGLPSIVPFFTTEAGRGRFFTLRITLEITANTAPSEQCPFTIDTMPSSGFAIISNLEMINITTSQFIFIIEPVAASTLSSLMIDPTGLTGSTIGRMRIEGFYENDYV